jgi:hypothetical protein
MRSRATRWFLTLVAVLLPTLAVGPFSAPASAAPVCVNPGPLDQLINCAPRARLTVDDVTVDLTAAITGGPKAFSLTLNDLVVDGAHVSLSVRSNADPFIDYAIAVKNDTAAPLPYDFTYIQPFVGGPYSTLFTSHSGSVTDSSNAFVGTDGSVTVSVAMGSVVHQPTLNGALVDGLNTGCVVTMAPGGSGNCPANGLSATVPVSTGPTGELDVEVHFTLSAGDIYTLNGRVELFPAQVPEPATLLLIGGGALALALRRRRTSV